MFLCHINVFSLCLPLSPRVCPQVRIKVKQHIPPDDLDAWWLGVMGAGLHRGVEKLTGMGGVSCLHHSDGFRMFQCLYCTL